MAGMAFVLISVAGQPSANAEEKADSTSGRQETNRAEGPNGPEARDVAGVEFDRHVVEFELRVEQNDSAEAIATFGEMQRLGFEFIPHELWYVHATLCEREGLLEAALKSANTYVELAGRDGQHYRDALRLSVVIRDKVEQREQELQAAERQRQVEQASRERLVRRARRQQESTAELPPDEMKDGSVPPPMVVLPAGRICFGKDKCRMVEVRAFAIAKHAVTVAQFRRFARSTRYRTETERRRLTCWEPGGSLFPSDAEKREERKRTWKTVSETQTGRHPVVCVSMEDANRYARWLSDQTGQRYRLPGQAEWDYAFLAGTTIGQVENTHPHRFRGLFESGRYSKPDFWVCAAGDLRDFAIKIGPVGSCPLSPVGLWFESGNFHELVHTCNIYWNGESVDGAYEALDGCQHAQTRAYFNDRNTGAGYLLGRSSVTRSNLGFRVVREL